MDPRMTTGSSLSASIRADMGDAKCATRSLHAWETASERWATARTEFHNAQQAADAALDLLDQARANEQAAWAEVVEASKREADVGALSRAFPEPAKPPVCANKSPGRF